MALDSQGMLEATASLPEQVEAAADRARGLPGLPEAWGAPLVPIPPDIPQPRAALGALAVPPLVVLEEIGLFPGASQWIELAVRQLRARRDELGRPGGLAEELARRIGRTIPLIY